MRARGRDEETGLPIGVLITGRRLREDLCLEAAEAIEARLGVATPIIGALNAAVRFDARKEGSTFSPLLGVVCCLAGCRGYRGRAVR